MPAVTITTLLVILLVTIASGKQSLVRSKHQGEDQPPPTNATCPQLILPGPPGPPGGLSYSEAKELKQDIKEELQESLTEWIERQAKALKLSHCSPTLGREQHTPAMSCRDIADCNPLAPSGATSTTPLMASAQLYWTLTHTMWTVSPSHLGTLVNILGHKPLEYLMITITMVITTVPVPHTLVPVLLPLLDWIISVNLESLVDGKTTIE